jgi:hypothetical protein
MTAIITYKREKKKVGEKKWIKNDQTDRQKIFIGRWKEENLECLSVLFFPSLLPSFNAQKKQSGDLPNTMRLCLYLLFSPTSGLKSLFLLYQSFFFWHNWSTTWTKKKGSRGKKGGIENLKNDYLPYGLYSFSVLS